MKVLQINETCGYGDSTGRTTLEMHQYLQSVGVASRVFAFEREEGIADLPDVRYFGFRAERKAHALLSRLSGRQAHFSRYSTARLLKQLAIEKPDVVILRILHGNTVHFPMLLKGLARQKCAVILILHDCWFFTGHCWHYTKAGCSRWQNGCGRCPALDAGNVTWFLDRSAQDLAEKARLYREIDKLAAVGVSRWITGEAARSILGGYELRTIYNWIDQNVFMPQDQQQARKKLGLDDRPLVLGVSSFWNNNKGWQDFLQAARRLPSVQFCLIGKVLDSVEPPQNLRAVGTVRDTRTLAAYYAAADVFMNPSVQETFGKTTAEAFCCGTPVVCYDTTASSELVNEQRGAKVPVKDTEALLQALQTVLQQGKQLYTAECLAFAKENFSYQRNMEQYLALFRELANRVRGT